MPIHPTALPGRHRAPKKTLVERIAPTSGLSAPALGGIAAGTLSVAAGALVPGLAGAAFAGADTAVGTAGLPAGQLAVRVPAGARYDAPTSDELARLRQCESTDNYSIATGNGFYGAYQFDLGTWRGLGLSGMPQQAMPPLQDAAANALEQSRGWEPWPACSSHLGLVPRMAHGVPATRVLAILAPTSTSTSGAAGTVTASGSATRAGSATAVATGSTSSTAAKPTSTSTAGSATAAGSPANARPPLVVAVRAAGGRHRVPVGAGPTSVKTPSSPTFATPPPPFDGHVLSVADGGSYRSDVRLWQERMAARGWDIQADGYFGPQTQAIARAFAVNKDLAGSLPGEVNHTVWAAAWTLPVN